ncbi:MAG: protein SCO1/2 [Saprospiraceae bacterium]|jgi:protein SCO1/2
MNKKLSVLALATLAIGAGLFSYKWQLTRMEEQRGQVNVPYNAYPGGDFTLDSFAGKVSLSDFKGQPVLVYFGWTYCPDVCPTSLAVMAEAMNILEGEVDVKGLLISLDPERDTVEKLNTYAPYFHPNITGLNSSVHRLLEVATRYGVYYKKAEQEDNDDYTVDHTSRIYLVDKNSNLAGVINHGASATEVAQRVRLLSER